MVAGVAPLIELSAVGKTHRNGGLPVTVLEDVNLNIYEGEFVAVVGASGSGKTTLMNLLGCLDRPTRGRYRFAGEDVAALDADRLAELRRRSFGFIFQRYHLIAAATVTENVEIPAIYAGRSRLRRRLRARQLLTQLGLADRLDYRPQQLSGGQQQRVAIARALMNGGRVIRADEPTGALDSKSGADVMLRLKALHGAGHTVVLITHDLQLAALAERRVQLLDGRIVHDSGSLPRPPRASSQRRIVVRGRSLFADMLEAATMAVRSLRVNLFRTVLTLLGIMIGVASVVAMLALGDGSKRQVLERIEAMGTDLLVVRPGARNVRTPEEIASLVAEDAEALAALPNVRRAVPEFTGGVVLRAGANDYTTTGNATTGGYAAARNWPAASGSFFSDDDVKGYAPVAVLGRTAAEAVFTNGEDPVGRYVLLNNIPFQVIGVLAAKGASAAGADMDDVVFMPLTTGRMRLFGRRYVRAITVQVADVQRMEETAAAVAAALEARHRKVDFQVRNMASLLQTATATQDTLTLLLGSVAAISLLVGGIGVMNIMLVSVTERVREIGIRIAVGARVVHIMLQFITEALVVSAVGGLVGVAGGLAAAWGAARFGLPVAYSLAPVLLAFGSAVGVGLLFGYLPARRAARLDPVVALAAE
ncbi:MAG: MacB family efflux pump subunit [Rhodocyclales bacterium]|nr:MacB family efflux pump subunit [Rhodocyclales bacterium]